MIPYPYEKATIVLNVKAFLIYQKICDLQGVSK